MEVTRQFISPIFLTASLAGIALAGGVSLPWLAFIAWAAASRTWSHQPGWTDYQLLILIGCMSIYLQARSMREGDIRVAWIVAALMAPGLLFAFPGAPNILASALLIVGIMAMRDIPLVGMLCLVGVVATDCRGAIVAGLIIGLCWTIYRGRWAWAWLPAAVAVAASWGAVSGHLFDAPARWAHYRLFINRFEVAPWTGGGLFGMFPTWAHNDFLQAQSDLGLVGLGLFVVLIVAGIWKLPRRTPWAHMAVAAVIIHSTVSFPLQVPGTAALFWMAMGTREDA